VRAGLVVLGPAPKNISVSERVEIGSIMRLVHKGPERSRCSKGRREESA
jgi:hypothetical protein